MGLFVTRRLIDSIRRSVRRTTSPKSTHFERLEERSLFSASPLPAPPGFDETPHAVWAPGTPLSVVEDWEMRFAAAGAEIDAVDSDRWSRTATNGSGLTQGHPSTLTWSIVPDGTQIGGFSGESAAPSDLRARLDSLYGSMSSWLPLFEQVFDGWESASGIDFVYEPNDDAVALSDSNRGIVGRRGDMRIGGHRIDGNGNVLAYNFFPNMGDMVIDTSDSFYGSLANNSLALRNTVAHEVGHGMGLDHSLPIVGTKLMEPYINLSYDGPRHDDILRINRGYGDRLESNDTTATASGLGTLVGEPIIVSNVSIDDDSDVDYFGFSVSVASLLDVTLQPFGSVYTVGVEGGSNASFDSRAQSDLAFTVLTANGTTVGAASAAGLGATEMLVDLSLAAGQYYLRVAGAQNAAQLYTLTLDAEQSQPPQPPVLSPIGKQTLPATQDLLQINLTASDANSDPLTFSATAESVEYRVDQSLGLNSIGGNEYLNWGGRNEKWLTDRSSVWHYITPDGKLYRWLGGSLANDPLVEQLSTAAYSNTALVHSAQPNNAPALLTISGGALTVNPNQGFIGKFYVTATVSDGILTDTEVFEVVVQPVTTTTPTIQSPPVLSPIAHHTLPASQDVLQIPLLASDANNDPLTFIALAQSVEYHVDQTLGLNSTGGNEYLNWGGRNEKWLTAASSNTWHYITPDGKLYRWLGGSLTGDPLVEQLSTAAYVNTALLYNAQSNSAPATVTIQGSTLSINPDDSFRGKFYVSVTVSDGRGGTDSKQFAVTVT